MEIPPLVSLCNRTKVGKIIKARQHTTNEAKRQHYIPRMLLRNFTNEKGRLYFFDKRFPEKKVLESVPANLFIENHLYTHYDESGGKDVRIEKLLSDIDK